MSSTNKDFCFRTGWLIDGTGGPIQTGQTICVQNDTIIGISDKSPSENSLDTCPDQDWDYSEYTALPCLVDCHVHMTWSGTNDPDIRKSQVDWPYDKAHDIILQNIENMKSHGITGVREGGDQNGHTLNFKQNDPTSNFILQTPGKAFFKAGRYGRIIGQKIDADKDLAPAISAIQDPLDHIKVVNSGLNSLKHFGKETLRQFEAESLKQAFCAAKARHFKIMVHANGTLPVAQSILAGCDSIEHGFFMGRDNLKLMADQGVVWVPTAITMKSYAKYLAPDSIEASMALKNLDHQLEQIAYAKTTGTIIAAGTDSGSMGVFHGRSLIEEIELYMQAGYSIQQAIKCASYNGCMLMGRKKHGLIKPGFNASFILVKASPDQLPAALYHIEKILINGKMVDVTTKFSVLRSSLT